MTQHHERLEELATLFEQAEKQVKKAEDVNGNIIVPSINELRYFGYHIIKALLAEDDQATLVKEIEKAEGHAKRAIYDASEALIIFYLEKAELFQQRHSNNASTIDVLPDYVECLEQLESINESIGRIRRDGSAYKNRDQYYEQTLPFIEQLSKIIFKFDKANPIIIKKEREKTTGFILKVMTLIATVFGAIAAIVALS
ncbi:hypothetical protein [Hydrogenovibrio halophilus]|uniref:hypothetical protein n=1 Tax=Hydrogenovibrio halophilus TaxID=373391 RepID=UPI00035E0E65|nr:hypothetical protein [Hydrogenovibrio halophilus]